MVYDLHTDIITALDTAAAERQLLLFDEKRLKGMVAAIWTTEMTCNPLEVITSLIARFKALKTRYDLSFGVEDVGFIDYSTIESLTNLPIVYAGLTWNHDNTLAGGALGGGKLTELGKLVITELEQHSIFVDTAHLNEQSFWNVLEYSDKPKLNSHTCCSSVHEHKRNLTDAQIEAIIAINGLIGLTLVGSFLSVGNAKIDDVIRHIDYFTEKFGYKNLAIGTDFYGTDNLPQSLENYDQFKYLRYKLLKLGYKVQETDAIFYQNAINFFGRQNND